MVLLYIIELFKDTVYCTRGGKLLILFDDMCHLLRMAIANIDHHPEIKRFVEEAEHAVDRFHFHKNHKGKWCRLHVNPELATLLAKEKVNTSATGTLAPSSMSSGGSTSSALQHAF